MCVPVNLIINEMNHVFLVSTINLLSHVIIYGVVKIVFTQQEITQGRVLEMNNSDLKPHMDVSTYQGPAMYTSDPWFNS